MRVLALTRYGALGASSRVRFLQYRRALDELGIAVEVAPLLGDDYVADLYAGRRPRALRVFRRYLRRLGDVRRSRRFDLAWVEKELFPWLPASFERLFGRWSGGYAVDLDDAVAHRYDQHPSPLVRGLLRSKIPGVLRRARLVTAGNAYLARQAEQAGARAVEIVPTVVDLERYPPVKRSEAPPRPEGPLRIGWIGSPLTARYLFSIEAALADACRDGRAVLVRIGALGAPGPAVPTEDVPWTAGGEAESLRALDVGVMPLPDEPFERGKCGYKLIQYMASGLPVVASPVGVNRDLVRPGLNGFLARGADEWRDALVRLRDRPELRRAQGAAGRELVEREYSVQSTAPRLADLLRRAARPGVQEPCAV